MIDTKELDSYYPGYDKYIEPKNDIAKDDYDSYEDYLIEKDLQEGKKYNGEK